MLCCAGKAEKRGRIGAVCLLVVGLLIFSITAILTCVLIPFKISENIFKGLMIVDKSSTFEQWSEPSVPILQQIYLFNVTNPKQVIERGDKPVLQQLGPYVYQMTRHKFGLQFNEGNGTVFYKDKMFWYWRPHLSNGSLTDTVTLLNMPYVGAIMEAVKLGPMARYVMSEVFAKFPEESVYVTRTADELLFGGYKVPFMQELSELKGEQLLPNNTFGIYHGQNGTDQGQFEIFTGAGKYPEKYGKVVSWNGEGKLGWWEDDYCDAINGSEGLFHPGVTKDRVLHMFAPGLCRSFRYTFEEEETILGVPVYKFPLAPTFLQSAKTNGDNVCFCSPDKNDLDTCPEDGVFQMAKCGRGPAILSMPHFYQGSHLYLNQSVGLKPNKDSHEMALYIEPNTGAPVRTQWRFQMNMDLRPTKYFRPFKKVPRMIHPLFWVDQVVDVSDETVSLLKDKLLLAIYIVEVVKYSGMALGGAIALISLFFLLTRPNPSSLINNKKKKNKRGADHVAQKEFSHEKIPLNGDNSVPIQLNRVLQQ